jgi:hypothetical protein
VKLKASRSDLRLSLREDTYCSQMPSHEEYEVTGCNWSGLCKVKWMISSEVVCRKETVLLEGVVALDKRASREGLTLFKIGTLFTVLRIGLENQLLLSQSV